MDPAPTPLARRLRLAAGMALRTRPYVVVGCAAVALAAGAAPVLVAWLTRRVIDGIPGTGGVGMGFVVATAVALALTGLALALLPHLARYLRAELDRAVGLYARERMYAALARLRGLPTLEEPRFHDRLQLASEAGRAAPAAVVGGALELGQNAVVVVGFASALWWISPVMAVLVLVSAVPVLYSELTLARHRARMLWQMGPAERREFFYAGLLADLQAAKEIRLFGLSRFFRGRMLTELRGINAAHRRVDRRELAVQGLLAVVSATTAGAGLIWAITGAWSGSSSVGDIVVFVAAVAGVQSALASAANTIAQMQHSLLMLDHYCYVTEIPPDLPVPARPTPVPPLGRGIELRDVWFRYSDEHPWILRGVTFTIPYGKAVALVGRNGAGKSTLVKLLCRMYDPTRGEIRWDGVDLKAMSPEQLRHRIGAVFQDFMEYELTARENIALGDVAMIADHDPGAAGASSGGDAAVMRKVTDAARRAGAHSVAASLPRGYDTMLSRIYVDGADRDDATTGVNLSGGQWQRLALARAFLRDDRDLLVLDEPSAGLDAEAEHDVHTRLRRHRTGRTSLLISHRLGTVRDADLIVVLSDGAVVESGSHQQLLRRAGVYQRLYGLQARGYQEFEEPAEAAR